VRSRLTTIVVIFGSLSLSLTACGGSNSGANQSKADGTYSVSLVTKSFPKLQRLNTEAVLRLSVRNDGNRAIPDVTVTLTTGADGTSVPAFAKLDTQPGLAEHFKPVWILDIGPVNGDTALANSWSLGNLAPGRTANFIWHVHPVIGGPHVLNWKVAPAMLGGSAVLSDGGPAQGLLPVVIETKAPSATVKKNGLVAKDYSTKKVSPGSN